MSDSAEKSRSVSLKEKVNQFRVEYKKNAITPAIAKQWLFIALLLAFGFFLIYGVLGGDPGLYRDIMKLGFARAVMVCIVYVCLMSLVLWPVGIFLETIKKTSAAKSEVKE